MREAFRRSFPMLRSRVLLVFISFWAVAIGIWLGEGEWKFRYVAFGISVGITLLFVAEPFLDALGEESGEESADDAA